MLRFKSVVVWRISVPSFRATGVQSSNQVLMEVGVSFSERMRITSTLYTPQKPLISTRAGSIQLQARKILR